MSTPLLFDANLTPHRSLGPRGFVVLMGIVSVVSFAAGVAYAMIGAWPVLGFYGLDVLAIYVAFRWSYRHARLTERVRLTQGELAVRRDHPGGHWEEWRFQPYWVRLTVEDRHGDDPRVILSERGVSVSLGTFLSPGERVSFAGALDQALSLAKGR